MRVEGKWGGETVRLIGIDASEMDLFMNSIYKLFKQQSQVKRDHQSCHKWFRNLRRSKYCSQTFLTLLEGIFLDGFLR